MKNFIIIAALLGGVFTTTTLCAQDYVGPKAAKKDWKMHKKESKIGNKMFRDRPRQASRKMQKARKKHYKMDMKQEMYK